MKISWLDKITWAKLHAVGTSKIVNTSFIWLAAIPALSRLLDAAHQAIHTAAFHLVEHGATKAAAQIANLDTRVPFNFIAFYYAAFFFTLAALLFQWFCPKVIKFAPSFGAFKTGGYSMVELKHWYHDMVPSSKYPTERDPQKIKDFIDCLMGSENIGADALGEILDGKAGHSLMDPFWSDLPLEPRRAPHAHQKAIEEAETKHPVARKLAAIFYGIGFLLFAIVALLNLYVVLRETSHFFGR